MKALFQINTAGRAYAWLLGFALTRGILDYFWWFPLYREFGIWIFTLFNTTVYLFTLYLLIPAMAGFVLGKVFSRPVIAGAVLRESVLVWIVYPAVTIISLITKSPPTQTIEWFRHIPTFMVDDNFLPAGMIAVIPVLIVFYTRLLIRHSSADWLRALASVLVSLSIIYLLYYQYTLWLFSYLYKQYGLVVVFGCATLTYLIPLFPVAERFHSAFGRHRVMLPRLVLVSTIISSALLGLGLGSTLLVGEDSQAVLSVTNSRTQVSRISWNFRFFQLYDQTGALTDYGVYLIQTGAGGSAGRFNLYHEVFNTYLLFNDIKHVTSTADRLSYGDVLDIRIEERKLIFDWNRAGAEGDPFLETFKGTDVITKCTATLPGEKPYCFLLDEELSADASKIRSWAGETFLAVDGDTVDIIALAYDDYTDGIVALGNDHRRVTKVSRQDWEITIEFENGTVHANCVPLAHYEIYEIFHDLDPKPVNSPIRCELLVGMKGDTLFTARADGMLEWIGDIQGEGK